MLDPWRKGGEVFWARTLEDRRYTWLPRDEVIAKKRKLKMYRKPGKGNMRSGQLQNRTQVTRPRLFPLPDRIAFFGKGAGAFHLILRRIENIDRAELPLG